jgi:hypothetical protein
MRSPIVRALLLSMVAQLVCSTHAMAGPTFKGGRVTWAAAATLRIDFSIQGSWRRDLYTPANGQCVNPLTLGVVACSGADGRPEVGDVIVENEGGTTFNPGDGTAPIGSPLGALLYLVTSVDHASNLIYGSALDPASLPAIDVKVTHTYADAAVYRAFLAGSSRMGPVESSSVHVNNGGLPYRLETLVNVGGPGASPLAAAPPIVKCAIDSVCGFQIRAFDPTGDGLTYRFSKDFEAGAEQQFAQPGPPHAPGSAAVDAAGTVGWDTTGALLAPPGMRTFYSSQVTIESLTPAITGSIPPPITGPVAVTDTIASKIALDFLIELVQASGVPPSFTGGPVGSVVAVTAGKPVRFTVEASDADPGQTLAMSAYGLPPGASLDEAKSRASRARGTFAWKPGAEHVGYHQVVFVVDDSGGRQLFGTVVIRVDPAARGPQASAAVAADEPAAAEAAPQ